MVSFTTSVNNRNECLGDKTFNTPHPFKSYLGAAYLLHIITIAEVILLLILLNHLTKGFSISLFTQSSLDVVLFFFLCSYPISAQFDARSRFQNYKKIKDQIYLFGFHERILKPVLKSRCQRDAALIAATELGHGNKCRLFFKGRGYRWYHLLPDFVFTHPQFLLSRYFWLSTFFVSYYKPRVNFYKTG